MAGEGVGKKMDSGLDYVLNYRLNFGLDWIVASFLALLLFKQTINARVPNKWRNDLTVGMGIYTAFGKDWVVAITLLLQSPSPGGWQARRVWS